MHVGVPSLSDNVLPHVEQCIHVVCVCDYVYASVLFKNGKGSFTLVHMHKGV